MDEISGIALFCEDIRSEASGSKTLVGVSSDNIQVPNIPGAIGKFCIYVRLVVPVTIQAMPIQVVLRLPGGPEFTVGDYSDGFVRNAAEEAKAVGNPTMGLITESIATPFPIFEPGVHRVVLKVEGRERVLGMVHFTTEQRAADPNASSAGDAPPTTTAAQSS